ncbi:MAG: hypothetical protein NT141_02565 [candidate division WWE3 bacterium]|nr:hypothetical protein [candidate division WWE3 bacterium]
MTENMSTKNFLKAVISNQFFKYWFAGIIVLVVLALFLRLPTLRLTSAINGTSNLNSRVHSLGNRIATAQEQVLGINSVQSGSREIILSKVAEVSLTVTNPTVYTTTHSDVYCATPKKGLIVYEGEAALNSFDQTLNLGKMEFVPGTPHDGQLKSYKLTSYLNHNFLALYQYGNCNFEKLYLVGWDGKSKQLIIYKFKQPSGTSEELWVSSILPETSDSLVTESYDNIKGEFMTSHWNLNRLTNTFEKV